VKDALGVARLVEVAEFGAAGAVAGLLGAGAGAGLGCVVEEARGVPPASVPITAIPAIEAIKRAIRRRAERADLSMRVPPRMVQPSTRSQRALSHHPHEWSGVVNGLLPICETGGGRSSSAAMGAVDFLTDSRMTSK